MVAFGGDEVSALVFDFGSGLSKIGYAGQDTPTAVFPSLAGSLHEANQMDIDRKILIGDTEIYKPRPGLELTSPFKDGLVNNWEVYEQLWEYSYNRVLRAQSQDHPLMFIDPSWNTKQNREKICELAFERFEVPGFYLGRSAVMSAFAAGRATAAVIESGASHTSVVPVHDGYIIKKAIQKAPIGGNYVSAQVRAYLSANNVDLTPACLISKKNAVASGVPPSFEKINMSGLTKSFIDFSTEVLGITNIKRIIEEFKETVCHVSEQIFNERDLKKRPVKNFEFPTGFNTVFGLDRFRLVESLFQSPSAPDGSIAPHPTIPSLIQASISSCDVELQPMLHTNAVLTGANTLLPGFADRVYNELHRSAPAGRVKVQAAGGSQERKFGPWVGGSILSSMSSFHQLWISKQQYEEMGPSCEKRIH